MLFPSRCGVFILAAASFATMAAGCSSVSKQTANAPVKAPKVPEEVSTATPGSADIFTGKELKNPVKVHLAYALWHEQQGNQVEARKSYDIVLKKSPKNIGALLGIARLDMQLNRVADAEARLLKAQKLSPKSPEVAAALAQFHATRRDWSQALEHIQTARKLSPYDPTYAHQLGLIQAKSGDLSAALSSFTEAVGAAEAHYNLGVILQEQGQLAAAEEHLTKALVQKPGLQQAQTLLTTVRQQRHGARATAARPASPGDTAGSSSESFVQPAAYSQPAAR